MNPPTDRERPALSEAGWRPIESAPKDGEWSLLGWEPGMDSAVEMAWRSDMRRWLTRGGGDISPTLWQPLPPPPGVASPKPAVDDINWKAEWEATSLLRIADAHVIERLKAGLTQIAALRDSRASDIAHITLAAVETGNG